LNAIINVFKGLTFSKLKRCLFIFLRETVFGEENRAKKKEERGKKKEGITLKDLLLRWGFNTKVSKEFEGSV
jgi:hypothetical protein